MQASSSSISPLSVKPESPGLLLGNSFPMSLIRRSVLIVPRERTALLSALQDHILFSFWGHDNTLLAASRYLGCDLTPPQRRPVICLDSSGLPCFAGRSFHECWLLSPNYVANFRPASGQEVPESAIMSWQVLHLSWQTPPPVLGGTACAVDPN